MTSLIRYLLAACVAACSCAAQAQWTPDRPMTIVVPYPPGGSSDIVARLLARKFSVALKVPVVVDNRAGAATLIATNFVMRSAPDGRTLMLVDVPFTIVPFVMSSAKYDPVKDFVPVGLVGTAAQVFWTDVARSRTLPQIVAEAKARPGEVPMASGGAGSNVHLLLEMLQENAGIRINHVPYKGSAPMMTDIAAGLVAGGFSSLASGRALMDAGRILPIAVTSPKRDPALPQVPTFTELGLPGVTAEHWWALVAPRDTPADAVARLNSEIGAAIADADIRKELSAFGINPRSASPTELANLLGHEVETWSGVVKRVGVKLD